MKSCFAVIVIILSLLSVAGFAAPAAADILTLAGPLAYIAPVDGKDGIYLQDETGGNFIFECGSENDIILTPSVSSDGRFISFVIDRGSLDKTIHIVGPLKKLGLKWVAHDEELMTVTRGAWPVIQDSLSVIICMPDQLTSNSGTPRNIYKVNTEAITPVIIGNPQVTHAWPLMHPSGSKLIYRFIPQPDEMGAVAEPAKSIIYDLNSGMSEGHFIDEFVFVEQWAASGELLFSYRNRDESGNRIYGLYDPVTRVSREIYRHQSYQGALNEDSRFLATIRVIPENGNNFDIMITDLETQVEINLTQSTWKSESLIGWIKR